MFNVDGYDSDGKDFEYLDISEPTNLGELIAFLRGRGVELNNVELSVESWDDSPIACLEWEVTRE